MTVLIFREEEKPEYTRYNNPRRREISHKNSPTRNVHTQHVLITFFQLTQPCFPSVRSCCGLRNDFSNMHEVSRFTDFRKYVRLLAGWILFY